MARHREEIYEPDELITIKIPQIVQQEAIATQTRYIDLSQSNF